MGWLKIGFNDLLFYLLMLIILILLAWLSGRYDFHWDLTHQGSNSLSPVSIETIQRTPGPLAVIAYVPETTKLRDQVRRFIGRYQYLKPDIELTFIDPLRHPDQTRRQGISLSGEILLSYNQREERIQRLDEEQFTNAVLRLGQTDRRWVAGLTGHGERDLLGKANHDLGDFGATLKQQGYQVIGIDLATTPTPPDNTALLIIASPQRALLAVEIARLRSYLAKGGNLLLLSEPESQVGDSLMRQLTGIKQLPGTIVDANVKELGIDNPAIALVPRYPDHKATQGFNLLTLFPQAAALQIPKQSMWTPTPILQTQERSWNETGSLQGEIERNPLSGEEPGPLTLGVTLTRQLDDQQQRILVIGDGDFLSNSFLSNAGNLDLGLTISRWLVGDDQLIGIPVTEASDRELHLSQLAIGVIGFGSLIVAPILLLLFGGLMMWRRNRA
ncbi:MAG: GldG family protein [Candidatus Thiodiazotropha sp. 6PLUC2]